MSDQPIAPELFLSDALTLLGSRLEIPAGDLIAYADEDTQGGADTGYGGMSIHRDEGRVLYALVRALKPARALEIGVCEGVSSLHLLSALAANGDGRLDSYDTDPDAGKLVTWELGERWTFHAEDGLDADLSPAEFVFEDSAHTPLEFCVALFEKLKALNPRVLVTHDVYTDEVYGNFFVRGAFDTVFPDGIKIKLHDCFRGLGIWINPHGQTQPSEPAPAPAKVARPPSAKAKSATKKPAAKRTQRR